VIARPGPIGSALTQLVRISNFFSDPSGAVTTDSQDTVLVGVVVFISERICPSVPQCNATDSSVNAAL
jgi:hypothetical protein